jgi:hypothetical protein
MGIGNPDSGANYFRYFRVARADDPDSANGHVVGAAAKPQAPARKVAVWTRCRADLIKEGFEWSVLQGAEQTITRFRPHIVFEFNTDYAPRGGGRTPVMADFFRRHRYRLYVVHRSWVEPVRDDRCV